MGPYKKLLNKEEQAFCKLYRLMIFSTMCKTKFVASNYFSTRANINTACENNSTPAWHQKLQKKG